MKKYLLPILAALFVAPLVYAYVIVEGDYVMFRGDMLGAPSQGIRYERSIIPETDSKYELGTSSKAWLRMNVDELCLTGDTCQSSWPGSGVFSGTLNDVSDVSTSSPTSYGDLLMWAGANWTNAATSTLGLATVNSVAMTVPTGLSVSGSPITTSGTFAVSLASGYVIPLTASTTEWATAYGWGNHAGLYDILGQATSTLSSHTTTYNHANYDTAYGWGNHASAGYWSFASTTLDYWFDNTAGITRLNPYMTQAYASSTFLTITDAQAGYDVKGQATSTLASHTGTYNHANYDTAYGWGNHALAGYNLQAFASSTYAIAGGAFHDGFSDFVANEHIDWTGASAGTIHATNYVDNNTNASTICSGSTTYLDGEGNCDDISGVYLGQSAYYATTTHGTIADLPVLNTYPAFSIASSTWRSIAGRTASSTIQLKPA